ncbi:MAG: sensor histidine kinase [bacterium]
MSKKTIDVVKVDIPKSVLEPTQLQEIIKELFTISREALVDLSGNNLCVATFAVRSQEIRIKTSQAISAKDLQSIKTKIRRALSETSQEVHSLTEFKCVVNGIAEEKYDFDGDKLKLQQNMVLPICVQDSQIGHLFVGSFDRSIALRKINFIKQFSKNFPRALRHLWYLNAHQKEKIQLMISNVIDGVIHCDSKRTIQSINRSAKQILDLAMEKEFAGQPLSVLGYEFLSDFLDEAEEQGIFELNKVVRGSSKTAPLLGIHIEKLHSFHKKSFGWMIVIRDVTKNWQSDHMRSTLTVASHEIKTPLNSILGSIELLMDKDFGDLNRQQLHCLRIIKDDIDYLKRLISDILDLSRFIDKEQFLDRRNEISLGLMVNKVFESNKSFARSKNITLKNNIPKGMPTIKGHRDRLQQVLTNLIENSLKYTRPGGTIGVDAKVQDGRVVCSIKDTGVGIPASELENIFKKFVQVANGSEECRQGYGLGLSISKQIIESMGGEIWAESEEGKGSTFYFIIPL